ncbi:MAG: pilus assembly protein [Rhodanobacteraceae bacterium]
MPHQRGAVLLVALIFLLLLTILALSSSGSSLLQEKMVGAVRNQQLAEFGAETALRGAEARLWTASETKDPFIRNCSGSGSIKDVNGNAVLQACRAYDKKNPDASFSAFKHKSGLDLTSSSVTGNSFKYDKNLTASSLNTGKLAAEPRYIIEYLGIARPPGGGGPQVESGYSGPGTVGVGSQDVRMFRITARSVGGNDKASRVVQSTFGALGHD